MFIESLWQDHVIALLTAINALLDAPDYAVPIAPLTASDIAKIATSLQEGKYQPAQWFKKASGDQIKGTVSASLPAIDPEKNYDVLRLLLEPSGLEHLSKRSGGILFEDPFYALLAGFNFGRFKKPWVEVRVPSREKAWEQRSVIVHEFTRKVYRPERYFHLAGAALTGDGKTPATAHIISGKDLASLELNGMADVVLDSGAGQLFLLYRYEAP